MTQQNDPVEQAKAFLRSQGQKSFDELAALMKQTGDDWSACLRDISEVQAAHQPAPSDLAPTPYSGEGPRWCVKEVVGHYLVSERSLNQTVARLANVTPPPNAGPTVRELGVQSAEYEALTIDTLRAKLAEFFRETTGLIGELRGSDNLGATFPHPVLGPLNSKEWLGFHRGHAMDHMQQIVHIKADPGYPRS